ncbi:GNAT family N-acetyltransferase, partial [Escherichia coli]
MTNSNDSVTLRLMTEHDLAMLYEWLNRSHIVEWWGGEEARPTLADVQEQYLPSVLAQESVTPYIAMLNGGHCCKVSDEAAFCLIQRPYISKTLLTRRISPRG